MEFFGILGEFGGIEEVLPSIELHPFGGEAEEGFHQGPVDDIVLDDVILEGWAHRLHFGDEFGDRGAL